MMDFPKRHTLPRPVEVCLMTFGLMLLVMWCRTVDTPCQLLPAAIPDSQRPLDAVRCRQLLCTPAVDERLLEAALIRLARLRDTTPARLWLQLSQERLQETSQHRQRAANLLRLVRTTADHWLHARLSQLANQWQTSSEQTDDGFWLAADFLLQAERSVLWQALGRRDRFDPQQWPAVLSAVRWVPFDRLSAGRRQQLARLTLACVRSDPSRPGLALLSRLPVHAIPTSQRGRVASWFVAVLAAGPQTSGHGQLVQACWRYADVMDAAKKRRLQTRLLELGLVESASQP